MVPFVSGGMTNFRPYEPDQPLLLPPSLRDWIPPGHLVWLISETVDQLDLGEILDGSRDGGQGNLPYHPAMMLKILIYAGTLAVAGSKIRALTGHRRATLRMGEARARLPAVQSSRTPESRR